MSTSVSSQLSASLLAINYSYSTTSTSSTQLARSGFYLAANTISPTPHISFGGYSAGTFTPSILADGDLWYEGGQLKYFDGTNIITVVSSGSAITTAISVGSNLLVTGGSIYGDSSTLLDLATNITLTGTVTSDGVLTSNTAPFTLNDTGSSGTATSSKVYVTLNGGPGNPDLTLGIGSDSGSHNGSPIRIYAYGIGTGGEQLRFETSNWGGSYVYSVNSQAGNKTVAVLEADGAGGLGGTQYGRLKLYSVTDSQTSSVGSYINGDVFINLDASPTNDSYINAGPLAIGKTTANTNLDITGSTAITGTLIVSGTTSIPLTLYNPTPLQGLAIQGNRPYIRLTHEGSPGNGQGLAFVTGSITQAELFYDTNNKILRFWDTNGIGSAITFANNATLTIQSGSAGGILTLYSDHSGQTHTVWGVNGRIDGQSNQFQISGSDPIVFYTAGTEAGRFDTNNNFSVVGTASIGGQTSVGTLNTPSAFETFAVNLGTNMGSRIGRVGNNGTAALLISPTSTFTGSQTPLVVYNAPANNTNVMRLGDFKNTQIFAVGVSGAVSITDGNTGGTHTISSDGTGNTHHVFGSSGRIDGQSSQFQITAQSTTPLVFITNGTEAGRFESNNNFDVSGSITLKSNNTALVFNDVETTQGTRFVAQSDDNFVFYTSNAVGALRAIWSAKMHDSSAPFVFGSGVNVSTSVSASIGGGVVLYADNTSKVRIDGTDATFNSSGEVGVLENVGNIHIGSRGSGYILLDDSNSGNQYQFQIRKGLWASPTELFHIDSNGNLYLPLGTASFANSITSSDGVQAPLLQTSDAYSAGTTFFTIGNRAQQLLNESGELGINHWVLSGSESGAVKDIQSNYDTAGGAMLFAHWPTNTTLSIDGGVASSDSHFNTNGSVSFWSNTGNNIAYVWCKQRLNWPSNNPLMMVEQWVASSGSWLPANQSDGVTPFAPVPIPSSGGVTSALFRCLNANTSNAVRIKIYLPAGTVIGASIPEYRFRAHLGFETDQLHVQDYRVPMREIILGNIDFTGSKGFQNNTTTDGPIFVTPVSNNQQAQVIFTDAASIARWKAGIRAGGVNFAIVDGLNQFPTLEIISGSGITNSLVAISGSLSTNNDVTIGKLGTITSSVVPSTDQLLSFNGTAWIPRTVQLSFTQGDVSAGNLGDGTSIAYVNTGIGTSTSAPIPSEPTLTPIYNGMIIDMGSPPTTGCEYVIDYRVGTAPGVTGSYTSGAITTTAQRVVHSGLNQSFSYGYKAAQQSTNHVSTYGTATNCVSPSDIAETNAYGIVLASQIAAQNLAAINADLGIITAGRIENSSNTAGIRFSTGYSLPSTWINYIDLPASASIAGANPFMVVGNALNINAAGSASFIGSVNASSLRTGPFTAYSASTLQSTVVTSLMVDVSASSADTGSKRVYIDNAGNLSILEGAPDLNNATTYDVYIGDYTLLSGGTAHTTGAANFTSVTTNEATNPTTSSDGLPINASTNLPPDGDITITWGMQNDASSFRSLNNTVTATATLYYRTSTGGSWISLDTEQLTQNLTSGNSTGSFQSQNFTTIIASYAGSYIGFKINIAQTIEFSNIKDTGTCTAACFFNPPFVAWSAGAATVKRRNTRFFASGNNSPNIKFETSSIIPANSSTPSIQAGELVYVQSASVNNLYAHDGTQYWPIASRPISARAFLTANQIIATTTFTAISFSSETWNTDPTTPTVLHNTGTNSTRMQIPTGYGGGGSIWLLQGQVEFTTASAGKICEVNIRKNSSNFIGRTLNDRGVANLTVNVNAIDYNPHDGDYYELIVWSNVTPGDTVLPNSDQTWFSCMRLV